MHSHARDDGRCEQRAKENSTLCILGLRSNFALLRIQGADGDALERGDLAAISPIPELSPFSVWFSELFVQPEKRSDFVGI
jgi:hypothetical protein